jgi:hypothetical protein
MEKRDFIGKNFWEFFNTFPEWRRRKEMLGKDGDNATLLVTNQETNEQYKVVCKCEEHYIHTYCFTTGSYFDYNEIVSITKV